MQDSFATVQVMSSFRIVLWEHSKSTMTCMWHLLL